MTWAQETLVLWSKRNLSRLELNSSCAIIWLLCDGRLNLREITEQIKQTYPDQSKSIDDDVKNAVSDFQARGLLNAGDLPQVFRPLVQVGFCNLWPGFNVNDNYFLWMLTHKFDVMLVDPMNRMPEILFYSDISSQRFDHSRIDRDRTIKILLNIRDREVDVKQCDYIFSLHPMNNVPTDRHYHIPLWNLFVDWDSYEISEPALFRNRLPEKLKPAAVCGRLYDSLFADSRVGETKDGLPINMRSPAPRQITRSSVSRATKRKLTIGMATYDDYDGVYFTAMMIKLFHPEVSQDTELLVIDNNPGGPCSDALQQLSETIDGYRYVARSEVQSNFIREAVFIEANSDYVLCVDSHVFIIPGAIKRLMSYLDNNPECMDLLQGPLLYDDLKTISTHFNPVWSGGMFGQWGTDERGTDITNEPFEIPMQGMGLFACRKDAWPGYNPRFNGFGVEEHYIHEKFRQLGQRTLCLPFLRWIHRFNRPFGPPFQICWEDRVRNYFIAFNELDLDIKPIDDHFYDHIGPELYERIKSDVIQELSNPFFYFDAIYCINLDSAIDRWQIMQRRLIKLGISKRTRRFSAIETQGAYQVGRALSYRKIVEKAEKERWENVMIFEDDALFLEKSLIHLTKGVGELQKENWNIYYLGGEHNRGGFLKDGHHRSMKAVDDELINSHAVGFNRSIFRRVLDDLPEDIPDMKEWILKHHSIDRYFQKLNGRYINCPAVSSQPSLLQQESDDHEDRFVF